MQEHNERKAGYMVLWSLLGYQEEEKKMTNYVNHPSFKRMIGEQTFTYSLAILNFQVIDTELGCCCLISQMCQYLQTLTVLTSGI